MNEETGTARKTELEKAKDRDAEVRRLRRILALLGPLDNFAPVESIPLAQAVYCVNCDCITRAVASPKRCAVCQSDSTMNLARALAGDGVAVA